MEPCRNVVPLVRTAELRKPGSRRNVTDRDLRSWRGKALSRGDPKYSLYLQLQVHYSRNMSHKRIDSCLAAGW